MTLDELKAELDTFSPVKVEFVSNVVESLSNPPRSTIRTTGTWLTQASDLMPPNLRMAHQALDRAIDRLYRAGGFASERERVEHLFGLYEKMTAPLAVKPKPRRKRRRRV